MNTSLGSEKINVAHICLFEEGTGRVLIQHNKKFGKTSFVGGKCDGKNKINTIIDEMGDEIGYSLLPSSFLEVIQNTRKIGDTIYEGTIFTGILPENFHPIDVTNEGKAYFYDRETAPLDDFITGDTRNEILHIIDQCYKKLYTNKHKPK